MCRLVCYGPLGTTREQSCQMPSISPTKSAFMIHSIHRLFSGLTSDMQQAGVQFSRQVCTHFRPNFYYFVFKTQEQKRFIQQVYLTTESVALLSILQMCIFHGVYLCIYRENTVCISIHIHMYTYTYLYDAYIYIANNCTCKRLCW